MSETRAEVEYRYLQPTDYDAIISVWTAAGLKHRPLGRDNRERLTAELRQNPTFGWAALVVGKLVGVVIGTFDGRKGCVNRLAVVPEFRGLGIAQELIARCEKSLHKAGALVLFCLIEDYNTASMKLFEKVGYTLGKDILYFSKRESFDL